MIANLLASIFGTENARQLKRFQPIVAQINLIGSRIANLTDEDLALKQMNFASNFARQNIR